jgi:hypothetical protein
MGFTLRTPEYPNGRKQKAIVVANDITYKIGSFEPFEDSFFYQVTQFARTCKLRRWYWTRRGSSSTLLCCLDQQVASREGFQLSLSVTGKLSEIARWQKGSDIVRMV